MYPTAESDVHAPVALLFSSRSRDAYAAEAAERGAVYGFTDARGNPKNWLKGEYAYLAPNAASALLARCNLKHDWVEEAELTAERLAGYRALIVPNANHLSPDSIGRIARWVETRDGRLVVSGRTNLPNELIGVSARSLVEPDGYTGWRWLPNSPFGDRQRWEECYVTGYLGHSAFSVDPGPDGRVLVELVELRGDTSSLAVATASPIGAAIVLTDRTLYLVNQPLELLGGVMQAHLRVEGIRKWYNPALWGDTIALFLRQLMIEIGIGSLWDTRLRSFGNYDGAFSFRQDVHGYFDDSALKYEAENLIPATFCIEDPTISPNTSPAQAERWIQATGGYSFIEQGLHNDSVVGDPPVAIHGGGLRNHVRDAAQHLGFPIYTGGRHGGGHMHPETLDAMDYLYALEPKFLGLCTFSFYHMIEYGIRDPDIHAVGTTLTYVTDPNPTIATPGFWFPYHPVVTTGDEWRVMRGWDRTHDYDSPYELVETILGNHNSKQPGRDDQLENGVFSFQYHPEFARDPSKNDGRGTFGYLRYAINLAERLNLWIANERQLYQRMADYQDLAFGIAEDGSVQLHNPTSRRIAGLSIEYRSPLGSVWDGMDQLIHIVRGKIVTVPPLKPGERKTIRFETRQTGAPRLLYPSHKGMEVLDARHNPATGETRLLVSVCRDQVLQLDQVEAGRDYRVTVFADTSAPPIVESLLSADAPASTLMKGWPGTTAGSPTASLRIGVSGEVNSFLERTIRVVPS